MNTLNNRLHIIHQFESGEIDEDTFNDLLVQDPLLKEEYELGLSIEEAIADDETAAFKTLISNAQQEYVSEKKDSKKTSVYFLTRRVAASFSIVFLLAIGYFSMNAGLFHETDSASLGKKKFKKYYKQFELMDSRSSAESSEFRKKAYLAFENRQFEQALSLFNELENKEEWELVCVANCHIEQNELDKAISILSPLADLSKDLFVKNNALWYLSLCQLKKGQVEAAQANLKQVKDSFGRTNVIKLSESLLDEL